LRFSAAYFSLSARAIWYVVISGSSAPVCGRVLGRAGSCAGLHPRDRDPPRIEAPVRRDLAATNVALPGNTDEGNQELGDATATNVAPLSTLAVIDADDKVRAAVELAATIREERLRVVRVL
jgi:hypothetical protein